MTRARLAVFDVGGTAVRDTADVATIFRAALEQYGIAVLPGKIEESRGASKREVIAQLLRSANVLSDPGEVYRVFQGMLIEALTTCGVEAVPGVAAAFDRLRANGIKVVLTTGFDTRIMDVVLEQLDWEGVVDFIVTADDVVQGRPAPDLIFAAMHRVDVKRGDTVVVVGDTANDLRAAAAAGVGASIGVLTGAHDRLQLSAVPHTVILESAAEVPRWLSDRDWRAG
jgi:phosphonatase-like hydrolase